MHFSSLENSQMVNIKWTLLKILSPRNGNVFYRGVRIWPKYLVYISFFKCEFILSFF